uniref:Uncharacterized protein n=1 Tax=Arundo donax TaxID=35708 RepID=A0A0A9AHG4_ARUDO
MVMWTSGAGRGAETESRRSTITPPGFLPLTPPPNRE